MLHGDLSPNEGILSRSTNEAQAPQNSRLAWKSETEDRGNTQSFYLKQNKIKLKIILKINNWIYILFLFHNIKVFCIFPHFQHHLTAGNLKIVNECEYDTVFKKNVIHVF